jgi:hypothetical protein
MERFWAYARTNAGAPAPGATITIYDEATLLLSTIFADTLGTPKANPFIADSDAFFYFYAAHGRYRVRVSGTGITTPYTWDDVQLIDQDDAAFLSEANIFTDDQEIQGDLLIGGGGTFGSGVVALILASGKLAGLGAAYLDNLDASALTGLNASALASGTLPDARLAGTYANALTLSHLSNQINAEFISLGADPSESGPLRLTWGSWITSRNSGDTGDVLMIRVSTDDFLDLASAYCRHLTPITDDAYALGSSTKRFTSGYITDLHISGLIALGTNPALTGVLRVANNADALVARNATNDADLVLLKLNTANILEIHTLQYQKALIALGGGSAPTLGTVGGLGPSAAAQNSWAQFYDSTGAAFWIPVWK